MGDEEVEMLSVADAPRSTVLKGRRERTVSEGGVWSQWRLPEDGAGSALTSHIPSFHHTSSRTWVLRGLLGFQFSSLKHPLANQQRMQPPS